MTCWTLIQPQTLLREHEPMARPLSISQPLSRCVAEGDRPESIAINAPALEADYFLVPKVIE